MQKLKAMIASLALLTAAGDGLTSAELQAEAPQDAKNASAKSMESEKNPTYGPFPMHERPSFRADAGTEPQKASEPPPFALREDYVVEPPDLIFVSLEKGLPGRPIDGERLVRPTGTISLGWYGDVEAAGLTVTQIKEKIIARLQPFLHDEQLGLIDLDSSGKPDVDSTTGKPKRIAPKDSKKVRVEITQCNSKHFYIHGAISSPGCYVLTSSNFIIQAILGAGGPSGDADLGKVVVHRADDHGVPRPIAVEVTQISRGERSSPKFVLQPGDRFVLQPGDRVVVPWRTSNPARKEPTKSDPLPKPAAAVGQDHGDAEAWQGSEEDQAFRRLERRMDELDRKLDMVLEAVRKRAR